MKICFFSREYPPETHVGGIGTYTHTMASALSRMGHTVHVVTSTKQSDRAYESDGVRVHLIRTRERRPKEWSQFRYSYSVAKRVTRINCSFDIVQASEFASEAFWFAMTGKSPLITRLATPFFLTEKLNGRTFSGPRPFVNWMEKKQTVHSDGIFSSTRALAEVVGQEWQIDPKRVEVIPNSIDIPRVIDLGTKNPIPEQLKNKEYLLYFGRLEERKGVRVLAHALPSVLDRFPNLNMVFVGSDPAYQGTSMREYIRKGSARYTNRVIFIENLPHEKLFPIVHSAKMVILPSLWEAFGFVCVEALAMGRPVIATSGSGFEEIIEDEISGYLVEPGNSDLLAEKITRKLSDEEGLFRVSQGARRRALDFDVSKIARRLLDYYESVRSRCTAGTARA